jgi:hypothetical protein
MDAGADVPADMATSDDGGVGTTADQLCRAAIQARCDRLATCAGTPESAADCAAIAVTCPDYFFNQASTRTIAAVTSCLAELQQEPCTDLDLELYPSCWSGGTRPAGAPCAYASDCQSTGCSGHGTTCGVCAAGPAATGASCAQVRCGAGDFCHPTTKLCTPGGTIVHAGQGQACDPAADPAVGCTGDLHCIAPSGQTAGMCQPLPLLDLGQPCYQMPGVCRPPLICSISIDGATTTSQCVALPSDSQCGDASCDDTTFCKVTGTSRTCVPRAAVGAVCAGDGGTVTVECVSGALCTGSPGVCTVYGMRGDPCDDATQPCGNYLVCTNGRCAPLGTEGCPLTPGDAGPG